MTAYDVINKSWASITISLFLYMGRQKTMATANPPEDDETGDTKRFEIITIAPHKLKYINPHYKKVTFLHVSCITMSCYSVMQVCMLLWCDGLA